MRLLGPIAVSLLVGGLAAGVASAPDVFAVTQRASSLAAGDDHSCVLRNGQAYCWGAGFEGQLGDGTNDQSSLPVAVDTSGALAGKTLTQISSDGGTTCALDSSGAAYCWGSGGNGELGDGSFSNSSTPVAVSASGVLAGKTLTQIGVNADSACALDSGGTVYCWGDNNYGELGDGSEGPIAGSDVPVAVDNSGALGGKTVTQLSAGRYGTCALDTAGAAYCWGGNFNGQFGDGTLGGSSDVPVAAVTVGALAGVPLSEITVGYEHTCVLTRTDVAYCWGDDQYGELGDGNTTSTTLPAAVDTGGVLAGQHLSQITAGSVSTCAVSQTGAVYCWGDNHQGQLGNGSDAEGSDIPVAVDTSGVLAGVQLTQVALGYQYACASDAMGAAYCWGNNSYGQLGDGSSTNSSVPVRIGPQPPTDVQATPGDAQAVVSWTAPAVPGGSVTGYTATASPGNETCSTSGATSCTITGLTNGTSYSITVVAHTSLGDTAPSTPVSVTPGAGKSASTTSITSTTASPVVGQAVTTQVKVAGAQTGSGSPTPTGVVTVSDGTQSCQASLSGSDGMATGSCQLTEESPGSYSFTASYPGDANFSASQTSAATTVTVGQASSSTVITSTTPSPAPGQPISTHVTVTGQFTGSGVPAPTGVVTISDGTQSCQASLSGSNGVAGGSCDLTEASAGSYSFTASYPGDADFNASQATPVPVTVTGGKTNTTTTMRLSAGSVVYGNETSLVVTVSVASQAGGTPSGKVKISAGATKLCAIRLSGGTGSCSPRSQRLLSPGKAALLATYKGDASFRKSSAGAKLKVRRATSHTSLTLSAASVAYGHEHSLKITVTVAPQFSGTPRGTVIVAVGQVTLCVVRLSHGMASCAPSQNALTPGHRVVVASYQGSANFALSSASKALTVTQTSLVGRAG